MSAQSEARVRMAGVILILVVAVVAAPVLDDVVGFFSEAPYVRYLPVVMEGGPGFMDALAPAAETIGIVLGDRLTL